MLCNTDEARGITMPRMTSKGQVTIPKRVRDYLGLRPGAEVEFQYAGDGQVAILPGEGAKKRAKLERLRLEKALAALGSSDKFDMTTDELMRLTRGWGEPDYDVK
jgi:AbrB family looped-hinge helix DNA binding protein